MSKIFYANRVFHKLDENVNIDIFVFATWKQKYSVTKCYHLWFHVQHYPLWNNLAFVCKTKTSGSLYSHALLIQTISSKSKNQVVHEQNFKELLSSTCLTSSERRLLDLDSEVMTGPGSIPTGGNILSLDFLFSRSKDKNANINIFVCITLNNKYYLCPYWYLPRFWKSQT